MTRLVATVMMWLALVAVVVVSGGHTVYYLLEWEWSRADIAGTGFVASLVVAATFLVLGRLRRIERRLDALAASAGADRPAAGSPERSASEEAAGVEPRPDFPWLASPPPPQALVAPGLLGPPLLARDLDGGVFIPVFLAAGLVVSVLAGAVERLAAVRHGSLDGRTGGGPGVPDAGPARATARAMVRTRPLTTLVALPAAGVLVIGLVVGGLYWASHYWSKPVGPGVTTMTVEVDRAGPSTSDLEVVETLGRYCALNAGTTARFAGVRPGPDGTTLLRLSPLLDDDARDRFAGCLEDAVLDWHRLTVTGTALYPR